LDVNIDNFKIVAWKRKKDGQVHQVLAIQEQYKMLGVGPTEKMNIWKALGIMNKTVTMPNNPPPIKTAYIWAERSTGCGF
jgi:hypothetical protein